MSNAPILAAKTLSPCGGYRVPRTMRVEGGLHYIRGNRLPYFSLTYTAHRKGFPNQCGSGGAGHELILRHFPRFADLAALHLSDIDGAPSHGIANGWYYLAGFFGGMGEQYHAGNSKYHFPIAPPTDKPWCNTEYRQPTQSECLGFFAKHLRLSAGEAEAFITELRVPKDNLQAVYAEPIKAELQKLVEHLRPRWKQEADACIANHKLVVFGDPWPAEGRAA